MPGHFFYSEYFSLTLPPLSASLSSMNRIPSPGEVWTYRSLESVTALVDKVLDDRVAYTKSIPEGRLAGERLHVSSIDSFHEIYAPPAEPWEHPSAVELWASIRGDGSLLVLSDDHDQVLELASRYRRPAICRVRVSPVEGSVERVSP